ncbi:SpvB/TcaC N-terminal domain-containing protein [Pseudomonas sp. H2_H09]
MSNDTPDLQINPPTLPKGGGAIQGTGKGWANVGISGTATFEIALPISPARGYAPAMTLSYHSTAGNGPFGLGWTINLSAIRRRTAHGVPAYTEHDEFIGPDAQTWLPERDAQGATLDRPSTVAGTALSCGSLLCASRKQLRHHRALAISNRYRRLLADTRR